MTLISEVMTRDVRSLRPSDTVVDAARTMDELNVGVVPVCDDTSRLVGMVTDRDIVVRAVSRGAEGLNLVLSDIMSTNVRSASEEDVVDEVLTRMAEAQVRRMPVVDGEDRLVGIVSIGDVAAKSPDDELDVATSLGDISSPAEPDRT